MKCSQNTIQHKWKLQIIIYKIYFQNIKKYNLVENIKTNRERFCVYILLQEIEVERTSLCFWVLLPINRKMKKRSFHYAVLQLLILIVTYNFDGTKSASTDFKPYVVI